MKNKAISLLKSLTEAHAIPGYEDEVRNIFLQELGGIGNCSTDGMGGVYCQRGQGPRVLLAGHMDEIGFRVQGFTADGFIRFIPVGGWWAHTLLSQKVLVKTCEGKKIPGVISSKPPHFLPEIERNKVMGIGSLFVDVGATSRAELKNDFGIQLGDPIAPDTLFASMHKSDYFMAKAFDNRLGMACAIQTMQELVSEQLPNTLVACGTVQEEVGMRGAKVAAMKINPDVVIVLEGPPADDVPGYAKDDAQGALGRGVQIRIQDPTAIMNPRLVALTKEIAESEGIRYQLTMRSTGGTDAGSFHQSNEGVPTIVLGAPARYIHSHNGIININDYLEMVKLSKALIHRLDSSTVEGLSKYV